jgi:hypothetical protein
MPLHRIGFYKQQPSNYEYVATHAYSSSIDTDLLTYRNRIGEIHRSMVIGGKYWEKVIKLVLKECC